MPVIRKRSVKRDVIGLIPAGGQGTRIGPLPCNKEIYPIGFDESGEARPKVACHYLLDKMRLGGIKKAFIILREGKWDIPAYLRDGKRVGVDLAYLIIDAPFGAPFTMDQAFPFVQEAIIALGFPDILFEPDDAFVRLLDRLFLNNYDVVLGLFPQDCPHKADMVDIDHGGMIKNIVMKPQQTDLRYAWGIAVWTPVFTRFMHSYVTAISSIAEEQKELFIGEVIQASINEGLQVGAVHVSDKPFIDIGTPVDLLKAVKQLMARSKTKHGG